MESKSDATVRKASAVARSTKVCRHRPAQLVVVPLTCTRLVVERSLHARSLDCAATRQWLAARREPVQVLVRRVESLPMHTEPRGGRSGHFDLSAGHPPPNEVTGKTEQQVERSHGLGHRGMFWQSHAGRRDGCSCASSAAVGLRDRLVGASTACPTDEHNHGQ